MGLTLCEKIIKTNTIKYVSLYNIPTYLLEMLDKEKITVDSRNEMLFLSNFMKENNLDKIDNSLNRIESLIIIKKGFSKKIMSSNAEEKIPFEKFEVYTSYISFYMPIFNIHSHKTGS